MVILWLLAVTILAALFYFNSGPIDRDEEWW